LAVRSEEQAKKVPKIFPTNKKEYKFQQKYCYFGKTFKEQAREVHVRII
jgi:hypothetical protein